MKVEAAHYSKMPTATYKRMLCNNCGFVQSISYKMCLHYQVCQSSQIA
jgi:hypothetical protein